MPSPTPTIDPESMRQALRRGRLEHARAMRGALAALGRLLTAPLRRRPRQRFVVVPRGVTPCRTC